MFWFTYLITSILLSLIVARINKEYFFEIFILLVLIFMTPTQIESSESVYAPSIFTFIFNIALEQNFSTRALRPLLLSMPLGIFFISLYLFFKRKFF